jgi:hypothetical protein
MRLGPLVVAAMLGATPSAAQDISSSSPGSAKSSAQDAPQPALPVSLDHIREALKKKPDASLLLTIELPSDFRVEIVEQEKINRMLSKLDFKGGPVPAGGLYAFEQQQRLFRPTERPLMQPYAAFSGNELIVIALENLLLRYVGGPIWDRIAGGERSGAERAAREEVDQAIATYCASRPDRAQIQLCTDSTDR